MSSDKGSEKSREVRLGVVMYGGVSLAIYINGVCQEFFRAVRGRGAYKWIKALTDSEVIVDIVSGTSAGGINGIMLAYSLCNEKDFSHSSNLWRMDGDIRSLLRSPKAGSSVTESLLNSEGYYQPRLEAAFRDMPDYVPEKGELTSSFSELDLFITGTDIDGNISTQFDDAGHPIDVKDHRSVFMLKHRKGRSHPFDPTFVPEGVERTAVKEETIYKALAKLARITSCFPAAFTPVFVSEDETEEDRKLQFWGELNKEACFLDGGVVDNKPFTHTLTDIFYREANRLVDRKLIYVEPDPETWEKLEKATRPSFFQAIFKSLIGIPGYESISEDLRLLADHNTKLNQYNRFTSILCNNEIGKEIPEPTEEVRKLYNRSCLVQFSDRIVQGILRINGKEELLDPGRRQAASGLVSVFDDIVSRWPKDLDPVRFGLSNQDKPDIEKLVTEKFDVNFRLRKLFHMTYLIPQLIKEQESISVQKRYRKLWQGFNHQIRLLRIVKERLESLIDNARIKWEGKFGKETTEEEHRKAAIEIWETIILAMQNLLHVDEELDRLLQDDFKNCKGSEGDWLGPNCLMEINQKLKKRVAEVIQQIDDHRLRENQPRSFINLLKRLHQKEKEIFEAIGIPKDDVTYRAYDLFSRLDAYLFPIEMVSGLYEKDIIETIRISPRDAEKGFSNKGFSDKVSGDALHHFGGFFKRSWRSNDILWGRLDGACQLIECLLKTERLKELYVGSDAPDDERRIEEIKIRDLRKRVRKRFFENTPKSIDKIEWVAGMDPSELFPRAGARTQNELKEWLFNLISSDDRDVRKRACGELERKLELIIEAEQLEIIGEELPKVITDALTEQSQWNQFRFPPDKWFSHAASKKKEAMTESADGSYQLRRDNSATYSLDLNPLIYKPSGGDRDPLVAVTAAAGQAQDFMNKLEMDKGGYSPKPIETKLGQYFRNDYRVGTETILKDIPPLILLEILSLSLLVLRNCILGIFGDNAEKVRRNPLYKFTVDYPLRAFHALITFWRRAPAWQKTTLIIIALLPAILLVLGILFWDKLIYPNGLNLTRFIIMIALPSMVLYTLYLFLVREKIRRIPWRGAIRSVLLAALRLAPIIVLILTFSKVTAPGVGGIIPKRFGEAFDASALALSGRVSFISLGLLSNENARWLSGSLMTLIYVTGFLGPYVAYLLFSTRRRQSSPRELKSLLKKYFQVETMVILVNRLAASCMVRWEDLKSILEDESKPYLDAQKLAALKDKLEASTVLQWRDVEKVVTETVSDSKNRLKFLAQEFNNSDAMTSQKLLGLLPVCFDPLEVANMETALKEKRLIAWDKFTRAFKKEFTAADYKGRIRKELLSLVVGQKIVVAQLYEVLSSHFGQGKAESIVKFINGQSVPGLQDVATSNALLSWPEVLNTLDKYIKEDYFIASIGCRLKLKLPLLIDGDLPTVQHAPQLARQLVSWANNNNLLSSLEYQMRLLNPEVLYYM